MKTSTTVITKIAKGILAFAFWITIWYFAALKVGQELILPAPAVVFKTFLALCAEKSFWILSGLSLLRIFSGFLAGIIIGTILAVFTSVSTLADTLISPVIRVVRATPVASFIILALLWIGKGNVPFFISMLMVIPVVWGSVCTAIDQTDRSLLEMARSYRLGGPKTLRLIYIPSVFPSWNSACVTALGLAWKSGIAAEVLCLPKQSIGTQLYYSKIYLETPSLFAYTTVIILLSFLLEKGFVKLTKIREKRDSDAPKRRRDMYDKDK